MTIGDNQFAGRSKTQPTPYIVAGLGIALLVALGLRLIGLVEPSLSHPEIYIPGIDLPPAISEPPRRFEFLFTLKWHFHAEPHPIGYYMGMMGWTAIFGDSHLALRLPQVLFGVGSVYFIYRLASFTYSRPVGLVSAFILAMHGTHIHWSQNARAYVPGAMFGIIATWLLLRIASKEKPGALLCAAYVAVIVAGVQTTELVWALFGMHIGWVILKGGDETFSWKGFAPEKWYLWRVSRLAYLQTIAVILSLPALLHAAYRAVRGFAAEPNPSFLVEYATFGFSFAKYRFADPDHLLPIAFLVPFAVISLSLVGLGIRTDKKNTELSPGRRIDVDARILMLLALVVAAAMLWMGSIAHKRSLALMAMSILPFVALALPLVVAAGRPLLKWAAPPIDQLIARFPQAFSPIVLLAILAPLILFVLSVVASVLAPRAFLVFTPYMLILAAAGLVCLWPRKLIFMTAAATIIAILAISAVLALKRPNSPQDYQTIAALTESLLLPNDLIFVGNHSWLETPLLYYLKSDAIVAGDYADTIKERGADRVWVFLWWDTVNEPENAEIVAALKGFTPSQQAQARSARAILYERVADVR